MMSRPLLAVLAVFYLLPPFLAPPPVAAEDPYRALPEKSAALVTVKFLLEVKTRGTNNEFNGEITCPLIDPDGLVLCSNTELGGYIRLMSQARGRGTGRDVSATPTNIEVFLNGDSEGYEGRLMTRDSERDLAWIRIEDSLEDRLPLSYIDFSDHVELAVGDVFYNLRRLHKFFGTRAVASEGRVGAVVEKPRGLIVASTPSNPGFGVPVFTADGRVVGITVLQLPGAEDDAASMFSGSGGILGTSVALQDMIGGLILPAAEVVKATELAREIFAEEDAEEAEATGSGE